MKVRILALSGLLPMLVAAFALGGPTRVLNSNHPLSAGDELAIDLTVGSVIVEASGEDQVRMEVRAECKRGRHCESLLEDVRIVPSQRRGRLKLKVERPGSKDDDELDIKVQVRVPRGIPVELDVGVGKAKIYDLEDDLKVDVGVGNVEVELPEREIADVKLDVGVGSAHLKGGNSGEHERERGFLGSTVRWRRGPGQAAVDVHVGVGEISMRLS